MNFFSQYNSQSCFNVQEFYYKQRYLYQQYQESTQHFAMKRNAQRFLEYASIAYKEIKIKKINKKKLLLLEK